jgi:hypothetical protein
LSNTRKLPGTVPAAFSRTGEEVPPSADVAEHSLAQVIGQAVALNVGQLLGPLLQQMAQQQRAECFFCILKAKQIVRDHQVACLNAAQAGEAQPELPATPEVARGLTQVIVTQLVNTPAGMVPSAGSVWACWEHIELPAEPPRQTGPVGPDGRPIVKA